MATARAGLPYPEGDAGALTGAARRMTALAAQVGGAAGRLRQRSTVEGWRGPTAVLFAPLVDALAGELRAATGPVRSAGAAVHRLADGLRDAQREIDRLAVDVTEAEDAAARARAHADSVASSAAPGPLLSTPSVFGFPTPEMQAANAAAARAQDHAGQVRADAERRAQALCDDVDRADRAAAAAVDGAGAVAPLGGGGPFRLPGAASGVPAEVRRHAPILFFHPDEKYLPADANDDWRRYIRNGQWPPDLAGIGNGAPIFYDYDREHHRIDYWYWRRYNDFRNMGLPFGVHQGDWEGMSVQLDANGRPTHVGYRQHGPICAMAWDGARKDNGHPAGWPALGSGATYPRPGSYDEPVGPFNDLAGGKPGEENERVDGQLNLQPINEAPWRVHHGQFGNDSGSPSNPLDQQPHGDWWNHICPDPADTVH